MIIEGKDITSPVWENVDVCIIGSGAGGATVANYLARNGLSVVVLEEGGNYPSGEFTGRVNDAFRTMYRNYGMDSTGGIPAIPVPTGKCLGGTTVVNMGTCFRAPEKVLKAWQDAGLQDYGPEQMAPYYDVVEEEMSVQAVKPEVMGKGGEKIIEGAKKMGLHPQPIRRNVSDACKGCGNCAYGCVENAKQSMILNAIPKAIKAGAKFYCDTRAVSILHDREKVLGVTGKVTDRATGAHRHNVDISAKVVVLAAGAFLTPAFLLKNKLCNSSGQVGKNLKLHLCARTIGVFDEPINSHRGVCQNVYIDDYIDEGIMLEATFTGPASQLAGVKGAGKKLLEICKNYRNMASLGIMISEKSAGRVRADNDGNPLVTFRFGKQDVETFKKAMIISDRILFAAGAKKVINGNFIFSEVKNAAELDEIAKKKTKAADWMLMAFHPQGTCRMGISPDESVVGPTGECHDLKNLYIADASVFPTSLGVNPQETIWAIATRVAEQIAKKI